jgi:SAM-dependent methyltransferase
MFSKSAQYYDVIYASKDYAAEAAKIHDLIHTHRRRVGNALLDVACGTAKHLAQLNHYFLVEGLDNSPRMLEFARARLPEAPFHVGDMINFDLGRQFDVITCMFSSIAYAGTLENLRATVANFARHLGAGGVIIVEPWLAPGQFVHGKLIARYVDEEELKITRISHGELKDKLSVMHLHYMVATPQGVETFVEHHELGLFTQDEYLAAFRDAGLNVEYDPIGIGRGLYIATKPHQLG